MEVLAHRGLWRTSSEKNSVRSLTDAFMNGFGVETDVRDYNGKLVISHDIADETSAAFETLITTLGEAINDHYIAINVKADGLQEKLKNLLLKYHITKYFVFDMSVPEMVQYKKYEMNYFTRHSDIERECVLYEDACGVWLDSFYTKGWLTLDIMEKHLNNGKRIGIISPEIHGFEKEHLWGVIKDSGLNNNPELLLCTDKPGEARRYFGI